MVMWTDGIVGDTVSPVLSCTGVPSRSHTNPFPPTEPPSQLHMMENDRPGTNEMFLLSKTASGKPILAIGSVSDKINRTSVNKTVRLVCRNTQTKINVGGHDTDLYAAPKMFCRLTLATDI